MSDPDVIWLLAECTAGSEGRLWCEDAIDECGCVGEHHTPTRYVRDKRTGPRPPKSGEAKP